MSGKTDDGIKLELAHVLFLDIVGYSKLLITQQSERLETLKKIVQETTAVRSSKGKRDLIRLPTGDGMALAFRGRPEAPVECALEIAHALKAHPELPVRMGIHSGPVHEVRDVNERANIAGAGIDMAQRVMDCGDAGHILLSKRLADDLAPYPRWAATLHDLGEAEVKHGARVHLFNLYNETAGNPEAPAKSRAGRGPAVLARKKTRTALVLTAAAVVLAAVAAWWWGSPQAKRTAAAAAANAAPSIAEKSVAVLPFENLSEDKANAYFADGIQDEILTNLAKIADLRVISRTSVMQYRSGTPRNLREIGKQLGVAHLLEGSVQRADKIVRVNAQLIDARTDAHVWAQTYDGDLANVFAIQSEIAQAIASQLQAKLAPAEKVRLETKPTENSEAYLLYLQANELTRVAASKQDAFDADSLYDEAIKLDPKFALAYARAAIWNSMIFSIGRNPERKQKALSLVQQAQRLAPDLAEVHLALGLCYYRLDSDYEKALTELRAAQVSLPNNSELSEVSGQIYRRQGRWRDALAAFARYSELDPRRANVSGAETLELLRQWEPARVAYTASVTLEPQLADAWVGLAYVQFAQSGDPGIARATLSRLPAALKGKPFVSDALWEYAMMAHDYVSAAQELPDRPLDEFPALDPKEFYRACIAVAEGDKAHASALLQSILPLYENGAREHPADPVFHTHLAKVYALLERKEEAIREAERAVELSPEQKDAISYPFYAANLAFVYARAGEIDQAVDLLTRLLTTPGAEGITRAHLRLGWEWDPLRDDARFQKILASPEPPTVYR